VHHPRRAYRLHSPGRVATWLRGHRWVRFVGLPFLVLAVAAAAILASSSAPSHQAGHAGAGQLIPQDRRAPAFSLQLLSAGGRVSLQQLRGQVVVLNFWASWCQPCHTESAALRTLAATYQARTVRFLGIAEDTKSDAEVFVREEQLTYPNAIDPSGGLVKSYAGVGLPETFIIDPRGYIRFAVLGEVRVAPFSHALDIVLAGQAS
jgi:cytochrome c biogenesis protein CcmG, thiol:disulfide interchange protein DsbE